MGLHLVSLKLNITRFNYRIQTKKCLKKCLLKSVLAQPYLFEDAQITNTWTFIIDHHPNPAGPAICPS